MEKMECPKCHKRVFDISKIPKEDGIEVKLKCPQCHEFVLVPCTAIAIFHPRAPNVSNYRAKSPR